jgi:hypothetical protein
MPCPYYLETAKALLLHTDWARCVRAGGMLLFYCLADVRHCEHHYA